jgi:hypothetical protein
VIEGSAVLACEAIDSPEIEVSQNGVVSVLVDETKNAFRLVKSFSVKQTYRFDQQCVEIPCEHPLVVRFDFQCDFEVSDGQRRFPDFQVGETQKTLSRQKCRIMVCGVTKIAYGVFIVAESQIGTAEKKTSRWRFREDLVVELQGQYGLVVLA